MRAPMIAMFAATACVPIAPFELPDPPPGAKSLILSSITEGCNGDPSCLKIHAIDGVELDRSLTLAPNTELYAGYYVRALAELDVTPGELVPCGSCTPSRALPLAASLEVARVESDRISDFEAAMLPVALRDARFPRLDRLACIARGGCLDGDETSPDFERDLRCKSDCEVLLNEPRRPSSPERARPPVPGDCPLDWALTSVAGVMMCLPALPVPPSLTSGCPGVSAQAYGSAECELLGPPCGADDWASDFPPGSFVLYVRPDALPGGAGTRASPMTLSDAVAVAPGEATIALAKGDYLDACVRVVNARLWGACAGGTRLICEGRVIAIGPGGGLQHVEVRAGIVVEENARGTLGDVVVSDCVVAVGELEANKLVARGCGLRLQGARSDLSELVVESSSVGVSLFRGAATIGRAALRGNGFGIQLSGGAWLSVERSSIEGSTSSSLHVFSSTVVATDLTVRSTPQVDVIAVFAEPGNDSRVDLTATQLELEAGHAVVLAGNGGRVDGVFRQLAIESRDPTRGARALVANENATAELQFASIRGAYDTALLSTGTASVTAKDLVIASSSGGSPRIAFQFNGGAETLERVRVAGVGIALSAQALADVDAFDLIVDGVERDISAISLGGGATLDAARVELDLPESPGMVINQAAVAIFSDLLMSGGGGQDAINLDVAQLSLRRARVENFATGFMARSAVASFDEVTIASSGGATLNAVSARGTDLRMMTVEIVDSTRSALGVSGGQFFASDLIIERSGAGGPVASFDAGGSAAFRVSFVRAAVDEDEAGGIDVCAASFSGIDLRVRAAGGAGLRIAGGQAELVRFAIEESAAAGLVLEGQCVALGLAEIEVSDGILRANAIGLELRGVDNFDPAVSLERVVFRGNRTNVFP